MPVGNAALVMICNLLLELAISPQYANPEDQENHRSSVEGIPASSSGATSAETRSTLWYGTPGAFPGGDFFPAILDLVHHPSRMLDFAPRLVRSIAPTAEDPDVWRTSSE